VLKSHQDPAVLSAIQHPENDSILSYHRTQTKARDRKHGQVTSSSFGGVWTKSSIQVLGKPFTYNTTWHKNKHQDNWHFHTKQQKDPENWRRGETGKDGRKVGKRREK
jgi:hypothetical protein